MRVPAPGKNRKVSCCGAYDPVREQVLSVVAPKVGAREVSKVLEKLAARVMLMVGDDQVGQSLVRAVWTDDESLSTRISPQVAHYTGQAELAQVIQQGLDDRKACARGVALGDVRGKQAALLTVVAFALLLFVLAAVATAPTYFSGEPAEEFLGLPVGVPRLPGGAAVETMTRFRAGVPWSRALHSWTIVSSHDTARFRTICGSRERQLVGVGLQATTPGVPMVFAGDELGLEGAWGEDARRTMPWQTPETWDSRLLEEYRRLIALRRSSHALARGGIRYAFVDDDVIAYLRETEEERLLCVASRAEHAPLRLPLGCSELESLYGGEALCSDGQAVVPADGPSFHVWRLI